MVFCPPEDDSEGAARLGQSTLRSWQSCWDIEMALTRLEDCWGEGAAELDEDEGEL